MKTGYTLAIVGVAACVAVLAVNYQPTATSLYNDFDADFVRYMAKYGKSYGTKEEFQFRKEVY
jgi:hypothetical protein